MALGIPVIINMPVLSTSSTKIYSAPNNDAGCDIAEGNYERFLTQINPDVTSIGLFRVRGTVDKNSSKYVRFARSFENATGKNTMYFKFD